MKLMGGVLDLLIVDDDPHQLQLIEALLSELQLQHRCYYSPDGPAALDFLNRRGLFESVPRPHLILLDVYMPGMDGCEVLRQVKSDPDLRTIPVVMLSSSRALKDVNACYREHANAYVQKPMDLESSLELVRDIARFWGDQALLPG